MSFVTDIINRGSDNSTAEKLAEIYFSPGAAKKEPQPVKTEKSESAHVPIIASVLAGAILISSALIYIFVTNAINIDIVVNKKELTPYSNLLQAQGIEFLGEAATNGLFGGEEIILTKENSSNRSGISIDLKNPIDLTRNFLLINLMPKKGGGYLKIVLRDNKFKSYVPDMLDVRGNNEEWQNFIISAKEGKDSVNMRKVKHIRLEFSSLEKESTDSAIHIRNIALIDH